MNKTRGRSVSSSPNASRESSVHSDASSMDYAERIQAQSNSNTWAEQMDEEIFQLTPLSYTSAEEGMSSTTNTEFGSENVASVCPNVIFQILLLCSRSMTLHHVTCHVTTVSHASFFLFFFKSTIYYMARGGRP